MHTDEGYDLLTKFLKNTGPSLKINGSIYLTMKHNQAELWDLVGVSHDAELSVLCNLPFCSSNINGYEPKRSVSDDRLNFGISTCSTYRLGKEHGIEIGGCTVAKDVYKLLEENNGEVSLCRFRELYAQLFGTPFPIAGSGSLRNKIQNLSNSYSKRFELKLASHSHWVIVLTKSENANKSKDKKG